MVKYKPGQWVEYSPVDNPYRHTGIISELVKDDEGNATGQYKVRERDFQDRMHLHTVNERFIYRVLEKQP